MYILIVLVQVDDWVVCKKMSNKEIMEMRQVTWILLEQENNDSIEATRINPDDAYYAPNVDMIQFDEEANFYYYYEEQQNININSIAAALPVPEDEPLDASDLLFSDDPFPEQEQRRHKPIHTTTTPFDFEAPALSSTEELHHVLTFNYHFWPFSVILNIICTYTWFKISYSFISTHISFILFHLFIYLYSLSFILSQVVNDGKWLICFTYKLKPSIM